MAKILIVEDSIPNRELLYEIVKDIADCDFAESGGAAVYIFNRSLEKKDFYDLILMDIGLPEVSGMELLRKIRESEKAAGIQRGEGIPVIMVTAHKALFLEAYDKGCNDYILKPVDPDVLRGKINKYLP